MDGKAFVHHQLDILSRQTMMYLLTMGWVPGPWKPVSRQAYSCWGLETTSGQGAAAQLHQNIFPAFPDEGAPQAPHALDMTLWSSQMVAGSEQTAP